MASPVRECARDDRPPKSAPIVRKLIDRWSAVRSNREDESKTTAVNEIPARTIDLDLDLDVVDNNVFRMIGDDDL